MVSHMQDALAAFGGNEGFHEVGTALKQARARLRRRWCLQIAVETVWVPVLVSALWVGLYRLTLLRLPAWPVLLPFVCWALALFFRARRHYVSDTRAARFLDSALGLDERVATLVEICSRPIAGESRQGLAGPLLYSVLVALRASRRYPSSLRGRLDRRATAAMSGAMLALVVAMFWPTSLELVKSEQDVVRQGIQSQVAKIIALKADLEARSDLPGVTREKVAAELDNLLQKLEAPNLDASSGLGALADAEETLRQLSPAPSSSFDGLLGAARQIESGLEANSNWTPGDSQAATDLGKAADAARSVAGTVEQFTTGRARGMAGYADRASGQAATGDVQLASDLADGAKALREHDANAARSDWSAAGERFADADARRQSSLAIEAVLSKLDDGRQSIAKTAAGVTRPQQVGFRRHDAAASKIAGAMPDGAAGNGAQTPAANAQNGQDDSAQQQPVSGIGPRIGQNVPAYGGASSGGSPAKSGTPGPSGLPGAPGAPPSNAGGQQIPGTANSPGAPGVPGQGSQLGAGGGGSNTSQQGVLQSPSTAPSVGRAGRSAR